MTAASKRFTAASVMGARVVLAAALLLLWEYAAGRWVDPYWSSQPSAIAARLIQWGQSGQLWHHMLATLQETAYGLFWGALAGVLLGLLLGMNQTVGDLVRPWLTSLNSLPKVALAPLFVLWFGIGLKTKVVFSAVIVFFVVFFTTFEGVHNVDRDLVDAIRIMGARTRHIVTKVVVPAALTAVFLGFRVAVPQALVGAVVGEIIVSDRGLGYLLSNASSSFDLAGVFAAMFVMTLLALSLHFLVAILQWRLLHWKGSGRVQSE